jgi:hypothetical protein
MIAPRPHRPAFATLSLLSLIALGMSSVMMTPACATAAPEPAPVPKRWELAIEPGPLRMTVVDQRAYFYITYKVTNHGTQDLLFAPSFELATEETGEAMRSGRDVPVAVTRAIMERLGNSFLEDQIGIVGNILRGPENAKEGLAIWPANQLRVSEISVYAGGFSGETTTLELPGADGKTEKKVLRKSYMMRYRMPGELNPADGDEYRPFESRWIMR